jgi:hypothetical protein
MDERERAALRAMESAIFVDPGQRGLADLWTPGCLAAIVDHFPRPQSSPGYVLTGFCCNSKSSETDGPLGSSVLCAALRSLGHDAQLLCDPPSAAVVRAAAMDSPVVVAEAPAAVPAPAFVIAVERPGRSRKSGAYRTMRAAEISGVAPLDLLLPSPAGAPAYFTVGVGDGGNEAGTGNIADKVTRCVPFGEEICTDVCCDVLVMAGVSNWGALAIAGAMIVHARKSDQAGQFLTNCGRQREILRNMIGAGAYDGCLGLPEESVDGMPFANEHSKITDEICTIMKKFFADL